MITVHKYPLKLAPENVILISRWADLLCIQHQHGELMLWARVDTTAILVKRHILLSGTGHEAPHFKQHYIATVQDGSFVWHFFDGGEQ